MLQLADIAYLLDVPVHVDVELDRRLMSVREVLDLEVNSVLKLNRSAGENLDIRLGGALIGCGEIVVAESITGVRITDFQGDE